MTKTLTEQWREGTLPDGKYYIKLEPNFAERYDVGYSEGGDFVLYNIEDIEEVLSAVPSYDEYNKLRKLPLKCFQLEEDNSALMVINKDMCKEIECLQKQLLIATKALKGVCVWANTGNGGEKAAKKVCEKALKEMEGVK